MDEEAKKRIMFVSLIEALFTGRMDEILNSAPEGVCLTFGEIWDSFSNVPVGRIFNRPNFEEYETNNNNRRASGN